MLKLNLLAFENIRGVVSRHYFDPSQLFLLHASRRLTDCQFLCVLPCHVQCLTFIPTISLVDNYFLFEANAF